MGKRVKSKTLWGGDVTEDEALGYLDRTTNAGGQSTGARGSFRGLMQELFVIQELHQLPIKEIWCHDINVSAYNEIIQSKSENFGFTGFGLVGPFKNEAGIFHSRYTNQWIYSNCCGSATKMACCHGSLMVPMVTRKILFKRWFPPGWFITFC